MSADSHHPATSWSPFCWFYWLSFGAFAAERFLTEVVALDSHHSGVQQSLDDCEELFADRYRFVHADIRDAAAMKADLLKSNSAPWPIWQLNRMLTGQLMVPCNLSIPMSWVRPPLRLLARPGRVRMVRFHHVSTDEVYGSLGAEGLFETTPYDPPRTTKATSDHCSGLASHLWLAQTMSNCSNNYGHSNS